jgi:hypothetical protein
MSKPDSAAHTWAIEYRDGFGNAHFAYTPNDGLRDEEYVMQRATALHGQIINLYTSERRES